ncbi:Vegetative incompatibility protein HET-E-1 [Fusarium oxysporum f. sp. raphani]|uniref:Vegetative incompatibility protein HET-E-1 n=1 Tax=Fusarium oxysporum f. sp. raphani TaxID=96318 RepID=A0A8J5TQL0_FUSOX|nr:Vegetative incompatibility protein HET-E-1 [Fusarium oxysporum f. sp. raphani]
MAEALGIASSVIAVVDLSAKVISWCVRYAQDVSHAKEDKKRLAEEVTRLHLASVNARHLLRGPHGSRLKTSHALYLAAVNSQSQLRRIESQLVEGSGQAKINFEALKWPFKSKDVQSVIQDLDRCTKAIYSALEVDQTSILLDIDHQMALDRLRVAEGASFDSYAEKHNPTCLQDTRVELLKDVQLWIDGTDSKVIFWLNGMAGTGKSTISRTVAQAQHDRGDLGASFFFKRGEIDRDSLAKFVSTLAYQLAWSIPGLAPLMKKAIDADSKIAHKGVEDQFKKLIREPLSEAAVVPSAPSLIVIIVDALDECDATYDDIKMLLRLLSGVHSRGRLRIRVLVTSRPELPVRLGFSSIEGTHQGLILHKIPQSIIEHDIYVFLRHEFANIRDRFNRVAVEELKLPVYWPGGANLEKLTRAAVPLFIFAATLCRFINDSCLGSPDKLLQSVLHHTSNGHVSKLDMTYSPVLEQQVANRSGRERCDVIESFRRIVGTIITLASPLPVRALALLLDVHIDEVTTRLRMLHSVLEVPKSIDSPVRLLHLSFRDYLVDPENKETVEFWVDEKLAHRKLAKHSLRVMRSALRKNICSLSFPELQYVCMNWVHHQSKVDFEPNDSNDIYDFLKTHFLHWLEVLSLIGRISESIGFIDELESIVDPERGTQVLTFLRDAKRFVLNYRWIIDTAPLQLYASAIVFAPKQSIIRQTFKRYLPGWISLLPTVDSDWNAVLQTLEGHTDFINSAVFSNDGKLIASGSRDNTVKIWNVATGEEERTLEGHANSVNSVVFSKDSKLIASGSSDNTVKIWNVATGEEAQALEGHANSVNSVVFSKDGKLIASGSRDNTVKIWNVATGEEQRTLKGHTNSVSSVVFSKDGKLIASGSSDNTVKIWNVATGEEEQILDGHTDFINSVVFSKDGKLIASGSWDNTVKIWNVATGEEERTLEGHANSVNSVVFSKDSKLIASGSSDNTVKIWKAATGEEEQTLEGHTDFINSVVFSKDGKLIASGSRDNTVKIWNVAIGAEEQILEGHAAWVNSVVFSKDGTIIASGSDDETVKIWKVATGEEQRTLEGHTDSVSSVVFSKDGKLIASGSWDNTVKIWNVATGEEEQTLEGHANSVNSVVFSKDGKLIASGSWDKTVKIWNVATGINVKSFDASRITNVLSFTHDNSLLVTSTGRFSLGFRGVSTSHSSENEPKLGSTEVQGEVDARLGFGINRDNTWITADGPDGRKILWLPPDFRPGVSATLAEPSGSGLIIGCRSGRVVIMGFRESSFSDEV